MVPGWAALCALLVAGAPGAFGQQPPPLPPPECSLDAETDCCADSGACPSSCAVAAEEPETVFGVDGVARSVTMCRCSGCARSFPEEYPVDTSTWCALMSLSSCGGDCVPAQRQPLRIG